MPNLETFFTPWHAILYSGAFAVSITVGVVLWRNHRAGYSWRKAMPAGYEMTVIAAASLLAAGVGDMTWHLLFGIERDIGALLSPTHMLLVVSISLILAGPLRSALNRGDFATLRGWAQWPMILSTVFAYTMVTIYTQFANPIVYRWATAGDVDLFGNVPYPAVDPFLSQSIGVASFMIFSVIMSCFVLFVVRRWRLNFGALTFWMTFNTLFINALQGHFDMVPMAFVAGFIGDLLLLLLRTTTNVRQFRLFAVVFPLVFFGGYMTTLALTTGVAWVIHLWAGAIVLGGIVGWVVSYLIAPPEPVSAA